MASEPDITDRTTTSTTDTTHTSTTSTTNALSTALDADADERDRRLAVFVACFNLCCPEWEVAGENKPLEPAHVEYRTLPSNGNLGRCGRRYGGRIYFGLNHDWAARASPAVYLALVIHELAHVEHEDHSPAFWEFVVELYGRLEAHAEAVETVLSILDTKMPNSEELWNDVVERIVTDPQIRTVDNRSETPYDRRLALADALDYDGEVEPFAGLSLWQTGVYLDEDEIPWDAKRVPIEEVRFELHSVEAIREWLRSRSPEGVRVGNSFESGNGRTTVSGKHYLVEAVPVIPKDSGDDGSEAYRAVEGDERLSLVAHARRDTDYQQAYVYDVRDETPAGRS